ncbi:hypothetical protein [uncultured Methanoregula sp.]|uniref:hypothetical protein n=1 Tax=uncultured Methanoregula sp. TaxID=1005933 RepID=UPI002AABB3D1|nr:hypothetical protein [uncultured Methanoregula sp.]
MIPRLAFPVTIALLLLLVLPAGAVSVRHIDATVAENGDTYIVADYSLSWAEKAIVYPAALPLLLASPKKNVQVISVSPEEVTLNVRHLVKVQQIPAARRYTTPAFSLADARKELDKYWFSHMVQLDGATGNLTIRFPDGEIIEHQDLTFVPSFEHVAGDR